MMKRDGKDIRKKD
jgi:hypothetical protein